MSSVATVMLVDLFGEAGGFELAVLTAWAVLGVLLGGVARLWVGIAFSPGVGSRCHWR